MPDEAGHDVSPDEVSPERLSALDELHRQVEAAVQEIRQLREENETLRRRIRELERRPEVDPEKEAFVRFDEEPATLRRKVEGFIEAIDRHLEDSDAP